MTRNGIIALVVGVAIAILAGIWVSNMVISAVETRDNQAAARVGGPFTLVNERGETVTEADFRGRYMLIYFGFTFCPDVCPTELQVMTSAIETLGPRGERIQPVFITIDPERDTPEVMARYVSLFHPRLTGLTGSPEQVAAAAKAWHVFYRRAEDPLSSEDYTMDHSSIVFLMGPNGEYLKLFAPGTGPDKMAEDIAAAM